MVGQAPGFSRFAIRRGLPGGKRAALLVVAILLCLHPVIAQEFAIDAQVDRQEVEFGGSLHLTITIRQGLGSQFGHRVSPPRLDSVPGFDIAAQRTAQNMSIVNGVGQVIVQTIMELVPQQPGDAVIPAMSLRAPDGTMHSTQPINIKILPATPEPAYSENSPTSDPAPAAETPGFTFLHGILLVVLIVALTAVLPFVLSAIIKKVRLAPRNEGRPDSTAVPRRYSGEVRGSPGIEDAQIVDKPAHIGNLKGDDSAAPVAVAEAIDPGFDFQMSVEHLKRSCPEADIPFYQKFFDLFRHGLIARHNKLVNNMTPEETVMIVAQTLPLEEATTLQQLAQEWEHVAFAGVKPSRPFSRILESASMVLRAIPAQERRQ